MRLFLYILLVLQFFAFTPAVQAHAVLPDEVMQYVWQHPRATDAEIDAWLKEHSQYDQEDTRDLMSMLRDLNDEKLKNMNAQITDVTGVNPPLAEAKKMHFLDFIHQGIIHILKGPDHILFVLSILLAVITWRKLLVVLSLFTVAHSITFLLAGSGLVSVPGTIVEPIIAFSIIYTALTAVYFQKYTYIHGGNNLKVIVFLFGLFHGLGFASVFQDLQITASNFIVPLIGFNVGIEIGQLCIVCVALPLVQHMQHSQYTQTFTKMAAITMSFVASIWLWQRLFA